MHEFKKQVLAIVISLMITIPLFAWEKYYGTEADDYGQSVCEDIYFDGGYVIGGTTVYSENDFDAYLVSIDPNGGVEIANNYGCPESLEILYSVQQTQDGGFVASGEVWPLNTVNEYCQRGLIMKTNYFGNIEWMFHKQVGFR